MKRPKQLSPHPDLKKGGPRRRGFVVTDARGEQTILQFTESPATVVVLGDGTTGSVPSGALPAHATTHESGGSDPIQLDDLAAPSDNTDLNASTTAHGLLLKATAPAAGLQNVVAIRNGETVYSNRALFDTTNPEPLGTAAPGTSLIAARRDHVHEMPDFESDVWIPLVDGAEPPTFITDGLGTLILVAIDPP